MNKGLFINQYELTKKDFFLLIDKMENQGYKYLCLLPVTESSYGKSPYSTDSAFSLSDWFLDMPKFIEDIEVEFVFESYLNLYKDYSRYKSLNINNFTYSWQRWRDDTLVSREKEIYERCLKKLCNILKIKKHLNNKGIILIGDLIFGVHDSSFDVKKFNECFDMSHKIGSPYGDQRWEFCSYTKKAKRYLKIKIDFALKMFDMVRVDHNLGYESIWVYRGKGPFSSRKLGLEEIIRHPKILYEEFNSTFPIEKTLALENFISEKNKLKWSMTSNHDTFHPGFKRKNIPSDNRIYNLYELINLKDYIKFNNGYLDIDSIVLP